MTDTGGMTGKAPFSMKDGKVIVEYVANTKIGITGFFAALDVPQPHVFASLEGEVKDNILKIGEVEYQLPENDTFKIVNDGILGIGGYVRAVFKEPQRIAIDGVVHLVDSVVIRPESIIGGYSAQFSPSFSQAVLVGTVTQNLPTQGQGMPFKAGTYRDASGQLFYITDTGFLNSRLERADITISGGWYMLSPDIVVYPGQTIKPFYADHDVIV